MVLRPDNKDVLNEHSKFNKFEKYKAKKEDKPTVQVAELKKGSQAEKSAILAVAKQEADQSAGIPTKSTEEILNKGRENKEMREELDKKMKELYKTVQSESYEREKIANMYKVRDIIIYSVSAAVLYYLLLEL